MRLNWFFNTNRLKFNFGAASDVSCFSSFSSSDSIDDSRFNNISGETDEDNWGEILDVEWAESFASYFLP